MAVELEELTGAAAVPRQNGELVFDAPWQSRAFGMAVGLHQQGLFRWDEFRDHLIAEIGSPVEGDASTSPATAYYRQWLRALESLLVEKGVMSKPDLEARVQEFTSGARDQAS